MNASFTSTSISIDSMSTMVQTPVRVKPPPAEIGEIISPGCALRSTTTPPNGARIACLSSTAALRCASSRAVSSCDCDCRSCAVSTPTRASVLVRSASLAKFFCDRLWVRVRMRVASCRSAVIMAAAASAASARERASAEVVFGEHAVEPGDHLARLHHHALLDQDLDHLAGDLRRDGGLAARHHVAGRDEAAGRRVSAATVAGGGAAGAGGGCATGGAFCQTTRSSGTSTAARTNAPATTPALATSTGHRRRLGGAAASRPRSIASERSSLALSSAIRFTPCGNRPSL